MIGSSNILNLKDNLDNLSIKIPRGFWQELKEKKISYIREFDIGNGNIVDFVVEDKVILEAKAKRLVEREDFYQLQRYLQFSGKRLGLLVNFRNRYLKPTRIIRIDTDARKKFN